MAGADLECDEQWILSSFFSLISPFLDPATREKVAMLRSPEHVKESIPLDMLDANFGGNWRFDFNFEKYWAELVDFCGVASDGTRTHPTKARPATSEDGSKENNTARAPDGEHL
jgi:hypothetical protein